jgi:hypothetical protein
MWYIVMGPRVEPATLNPSNVLWEFAQLAEYSGREAAGRVCRFVRCYGALHFGHEPRGSALVAPVAVYTQAAGLIAGIVNVALTVLDGNGASEQAWSALEAASESTWRVIKGAQEPEASEGSGPARPGTLGYIAQQKMQVPQEPLPSIAEHSPREQGEYLAQIVSSLLPTADVSFGVECFGSKPSGLSFAVTVEPSPGLIGAVWYTVVRRLLEVLTLPRNKPYEGIGLFRCTECGAAHERKRAPRSGARGLCPQCRRNEAAARKRRSRSKHAS